MPTEFRRILEQNFGSDVFITSVTGESAWVYPLASWEQVERKLADVPSADRSRLLYLERVNYFGQQLRLDAQGRVVIPQILRDRAQVLGEVVVSGRLDFLEVWNRERFENRLLEQPFTEQHFQDLAEHGI